VVDGEDWDVVVEAQAAVVGGEMENESRRREE